MLLSIVSQLPPEVNSRSGSAARLKMFCVTNYRPDWYMYTSPEMCVCDDYCEKTTNHIILQRGRVIVSPSTCGLVCQHCGYVTAAANQVSG